MAINPLAPGTPVEFRKVSIFQRDDELNLPWQRGTLGTVHYQHPPVGTSGWIEYAFVVAEDGTVHVVGLKYLRVIGKKSKKQKCKHEASAKQFTPLEGGWL